MIVGILGGGQLGMMLGEAAKKLDVTCRFLDPSPTPPAQTVGEVTCAQYDDKEALEKFSEGLSVITYEFENVPVETAEFLEKKFAVFPPSQALKVAQDRLLEKKLFTKLKIPTVPFAKVENVGDLQKAIEKIGFSAVLKTRRQGYDGKGQEVLHNERDAESVMEELDDTPRIYEGFIPFDRELSIIAVRSKEGEIVFYPLVENHHRKGILRFSRAPAPNVSEALQKKAREYAKKILEEFLYVGVLTIEFFEKDGELLANEIAPRVHNSGHWTIEGAKTSQFENHLRAVCGLPLGSTDSIGASVMLNLIGSVPESIGAFSDKNIHVHLYGKEARPKRKLGHITIVAASEEERDKKIAALGGLL